MRIENRVPLCRSCHNWAQNGTKKTREVLIAYKELFIRNNYGMSAEEFYERNVGEKA